MIITKADIKNFGQFHDRTIHFSPGLNVVYGGNECGKSTLQGFLCGMLFGMEKQRGRARTDPYQRYEPWNAPSYYAGALDFTVDGRKFCLERNFYHKEKSARLYNSIDREELSVEQGDLTMLLGGMNRKTFEQTCCVPQAAVETEKSFGVELKNYLVNISHGGQGEFDLAEARKRLQDRIQKARREKKEQEQMREERVKRLRWERGLLLEEVRGLEHKIEQQSKEIIGLEHKIERQPKEVMGLEQRVGRQAEEIRSEQRVGRQAGEIRLAQDHGTAQRESPLEETQPSVRVVKGKHLAALAVMLLWAFFWRSVLKLPEQPFGFVEIVLWMIYILWIAVPGFLLVVENKRKSRETGEPPSAEAGQSSDIFLDREERPDPDVTLLEDKKSRKKIWEDQLEEKSIRLLNLEDEIVEASGMQEKEQEAFEELKGAELAYASLGEVARELYEDSRDGLYASVSEIFCRLTAGAYDQVELTDEMELLVYGKDKSLKPWELSRGTMEQLYLALRLGAGRMLTAEEPMPILLDETFCAYDDVRLGRTLKWLLKQKDQVILFTCQHREQEALKQIGAVYHSILL